ncbi:hypothetical protein [Neisseria meningitidis]|uniref:hypothetical protein n=1 Tax=Neisseria meningitidis TaxID=487 RepID=UPI001EFD6CE4|nr:hypothetical protein [Neisseria meningitidis]
MPPSVQRNPAQRRLQILFPDESALTLMHILKRELPDTPAIGIKTKSKTCLNVKLI